MFLLLYSSLKEGIIYLQSCGSIALTFDLIWIGKMTVRVNVVTEIQPRTGHKQPCPKKVTFKLSLSWSQS